MATTPGSTIVESHANGQEIVSGFSARNLLKPLWIMLAVTAAGLALSLLMGPTRLETPNFEQSPARPAVYAVNPDDSWNRIFSALFSRTVKTRLLAELNQGMPTTRIRYGQIPHELDVSTHLSERVEIGDRAIEPLYPSFINYDGVIHILSEPLYSQFKQALNDALEEKTTRPPLNRALMQSDLWAAYDLLFGNSYFNGPEARQLHDRRDQLLPLLARFIKTLALSEDEINRLPDNYVVAANGYQLPALFDQGSGWLEVEWFPNRVHDHAVGFRRATRVFIKPLSPPSDKQAFLNSLRASGDIVKLEAVALVTQNLLIDHHGKVTPSRLSYDVQFRHFVRNERGDFIRTDVEEYEFSRQLLLLKGASGGLVHLDEKAPAYLPEAGNDLGFASPQRSRRDSGLPILATLRSRCVACHVLDNAVPATFNTVMPPPFPPVTQLDPLVNKHALYVARRKMESADFKALSSFTTQERLQP